MREKIVQLLEDKVNEVFLEMQDDLGIQDGGIFPLDELDLNDCKEHLAEVIERVLNTQQG